MTDFVEDGPERVRLVVVGAHLKGFALNHQLVVLGAIFEAETRTEPIYRLYELAGSVPAKPGMLNVGAQEGGTIAVELWSMTFAAFGRFIEGIPPPLTIGTVHLEGGASAKGFLVEPFALAGARDITSCGGWRNYCATLGAGGAPQGAKGS